MSNAVQDAVPVEVELARSDADLVARFVAVKDEAAFAELVRRHSGLVMGVCRRVLGNADDVDDVFQATFLVLVRDAARVKKRASLASWLYGVAYRLAVRVCQQKQRRRETEQVDDHSRTSQSGLGDDTLTELVNRYDQQLVDAELNALPDRYRQPLVLRYLVGKSPREVAGELGITIDAVDGLLKRGKDKLRARLIRRGGLMWATLVAVQLTHQTAQAASSETLIEATVQTGLAWNSANPSALDLISDRVLELSGQELATMATLTKTGLAIGLTTGALALGLGGTGFLVNQLHDRANAGIVSTLPVATSSSRGLVTTVLAADPDVNVAVVDAGAAIADQPGEENKEAAQTKQPVLRDAGDTMVEGKSNAVNVAVPSANVPARWDFKQRSPAVQRIERTITEAIEIAFVDTPLDEAISHLADMYQLTILIDKEALSSDGIAIDSLVSLNASGVSMGSGLGLILEPLQLDYIIKNEVLVITTRAKAEETMEPRVYNVARIPHLTPKELVEIIAGSSGVQSEQSVGGGTAVSGTPGSEKTASVAPSLGTAPRPGNSSLIGASWAETDGAGGTAWAGKTTLVIRHTQRVHREIVELLDQLAKEEFTLPKTPATLDGPTGGVSPFRPSGSPIPVSAPSALSGTGFKSSAKEPPGNGGSAPAKTAR